MVSRKRRTNEEIIREDNKKNKGTIYKRGTVYWLEYYVSSKRIREPLETKDIAEAIDKRKLIVNPLMVRKKEDKLQAIVDRVRATIKKRTEAERKKRIHQQRFKNIGRLVRVLFQ